MRIIHAADVHLDTPYARRSDAMRHRLQEAGREALIRLVDLAIGEEADALLIVGDLFDKVFMWMFFSYFACYWYFDRFFWVIALRYSTRLCPGVALVPYR